MESVITIKVGDWDSEYEEKNLDVSSDDAIIECLIEGHTTAEVGRIALMAREKGDAPDNILKPNKLLLQAAARAEIGQKAGRKRTIELEDGRVIKGVREYVGPVVRRELDVDDEQLSLEIESIEGPEFAYVQSELALARAKDYLIKVIPGHIYSRLAIIAVNEGDVEAAMNELISEIEGVVVQLRQPVLA